jgi:hypothetical protein
MPLLKISLAAIALAAICGCGRPVQRFVPVGDAAGAGTALDTKTGQLCRTLPTHSDSDPIPKCYDLYRGTK